jgi:molybdenum cofactor sulfurtransferase
MTSRELVDEADCAAARQAFLQNLAPHQTQAISRIEALRTSAFARIDEQHHTYLDYTGGSLCPRPLLDAYKEGLESSVMGNPHSRNPTSTEATETSKEARKAALDYFGATQQPGAHPYDFDAYDYLCIFTANASHGLRLIGEAYPFTPDGTFGILRDNHNSAVAIREYAKAKGARVAYADVTKPALQLDGASLDDLIATTAPSADNLFVLPAQSNFSGLRQALSTVTHLQANGYDVLLDAAAYAPTSRLHLSDVKPAFAVAAFYKMFGFPTGIGVLFVRQDVAPKLARPTFAGGSVEFVSSLVDHRFTLLPGHAAFEDGTINYLGLKGITLGLQFLDKHIADIKANTHALTLWTLAHLKSLRHPDGTPQVIIYGDQESDLHGATIAFNLTDPSGSISTGLVPYQQVEAQAAAYMISLRAGRFCNHILAEQAFGVPAPFMQSLVETMPDCTNKQLVEAATGHPFPIGAVRISFGIASTFRDAYTLVQFVKTYQEQAAVLA